MSEKVVIVRDAPGTRSRSLLPIILGVSLIALPLLLRHFVIEAFKIPAGSMIPTLQINDHIFVDKTGWTPHRGEVIVFKYPKEPDKDFVKRVVGLPGDHLEMRGEFLFVNGKRVDGEISTAECSYRDFDEVNGRWEARQCRALDEDLDGHHYRLVLDPTGSHFPPPANEWIVRPGEVFVLGDNRDNSHDSRYWGGVPLANIKGRAIRIWYRNGFAWSPIP